LPAGSTTTRRSGRTRGTWAAALAAAALSGASAAAADRPRGTRIEELSLEELMQVEVTTVAGVAQARFASPAAIYVLSGDDIRRGGHKTIAEALRMVPGMYVGRVSARSWVVGARGLTGSNLTSTRYLVLVDGRIAYEPLFSATLWDVVDVILADVDRIEVIRGPGATLWGANAMNGVINVITRSAHDTQGTRVVAGGGYAERAFATVRHGGALGEGGAFRVWGKYADRAAFDLAAGGSNHDQWSALRGGFLLDLAHGPATTWTLQGEAYRHPTARTAARLPLPGRHLEFEQRTTDDEIDGAHLLVRAGRDAGEGSGWTLQGYYDLANRDTPHVGLRRETVDLDFRSWRRWGAGQDVVWGLQFDATLDRIDNGPTLIFDPTSRSWSTFNAFVQNTTELVEGRLFAMVGTKLTHHEFVGLEAQPGARLWWTPDERQTLWAAVSRPVRVPSRLEEDGLLVFGYADTGLSSGGPPSGVILPFGLAGDRDLDVERLVAYELGHRLWIRDGWALDTSLFYHDYSSLVSVPPATLGRFTDAGSGETYGLDVTSSWRMGDRARVEASYSWLEVQIRGPVLQFEEDRAPQHLAQLRTSWDLRENLEAHGAIYHVDWLPGLDVDANERLDLGLTWRPRPGLELAAWGQNLLDEAHREASTVEIPRSFYAHLTVSF